MVGASRIEVTATINDEEFIASKFTNVTARTAWISEIPFETDDTIFGKADPLDHDHLGQAKFDFDIFNLEVDNVPSGPNKGLWYVTRIDVEMPITVRVNKHFGMAEEDMPQSWLNFKNAQDEVAYDEIEDAVKKHEGFLGPTPQGLKSNNHYSYWHLNVVKLGTSEDPEARAEALIGPRRVSKAVFLRAVKQDLNIMYYAEWAVERMQGHEPPGYLGPRKIKYPSAKNKD